MDWLAGWLAGTRSKLIGIFFFDFLALYTMDLIRGMCMEP